MDVAEFAAWTSLAVAIGTGALAWATFKMASAARDQAAETKRLAETAERQLDTAERQLAATGEPVVIVDDRSPGAPYHHDYMGGDFSAGVVVNVRNIGATPATLLSATLDLGVMSLPGGDMPRALGVDERAPIYFEAGDDVAEGHALVRVEYEGAGAGVRKTLRARLTCQRRRLLLEQQQTVDSI